MSVFYWKWDAFVWFSSFFLLWHHLPVTRAQCNNKTQVRTAFATHSSELVSPNYPNRYPSDADCRWLIESVTADPSYVVQLTALMVDVETSPNCWKDAVTIYDGPSARSRELAQLCEHYGHGVHVQTFFSSGNNMFVHFRSDSQGERTGFRFQYQVINVANTTQMTTPEPVDVDTAKTVMTGLGVALVLIMIIAIIIACLRSRYCPSQSQLTDDASVFNVRDMDSPVNAGHLGSGGVINRGFHGNGELTLLPPNYSDLSVRNGVVSTEQAADNVGSQCHVTRVESNGSSLPPRYTDSMIDMFPPQTPPIARNDSIPPPSSPYPGNPPFTFAREDSIPPPSSPYPEHRHPDITREDSVPPPSSQCLENPPSFFIREDSVPPPPSPYPEHRHPDNAREDIVSSSSPYPEHRHPGITRDDSRPPPTSPYPEHRHPGITRDDSIPPPSSPYPESRHTDITRDDCVPPPSSPYPENRHPDITREDSIPPPSSPYPGHRNPDITREDSVPPPSSPYPEHRHPDITREDSVPPPSTHSERTLSAPVSQESTPVASPNPEPSSERFVISI